MKQNIVIELGERYLKAAIGKPKTPRQSALVDLEVEPINSVKDEDVTKVLVNMLKRLKLKPQGVTVSIPRNLVTTRNLHLPSKDKKEISQMIDLHIPRIVPYKKEEVVFDHRFLGTDELGYAKELLAIVHGGAVRRQSRILEAAGLAVDRVVLSSYGVWQRVVHTHKPDILDKEIYLLLDIDSTFTDFIMFSRENLLFTRSINIGADTLKAASGTEFKKLLGDTRQSLIVFYNEELNKKPSAVFLGGALIAGNFHKALETELNIPAKSVSFPYTRDMAKSKDRAIPEDISLGAVTEFAIEPNDKAVSFVLPETQIKKALKEKARDLTILGSMVIYILTIALLVFLGRVYNHESHHMIVSQYNKLIEEDIGDLVGRSKKVKFIKERLSFRKMPLELLGELEETVSPEIAVNLVSMDESCNVILRGQSAQLSDVFKFVNALEKSKRFTDVTTKYTRTKKVRDREITDFEINLRFAQKGSTP